MAHNLKLNIWSIGFEEKIGNEYSDIDIKTVFSSFLDNTETDKKEIFQNFVKKYIASFNDQFVNDEDETKAFTYEDIKFDSGKNIIYGRIKGGITGIEQDVYFRDSKEPTDKKIHKDEVSTLPYHFFIWLPYDSNMGFLMTQSYTSISINNVFLEHFATLFKSKKIRINKSPQVSKKRLEEFYNSSYVYRISLVKKKLPRDARKKFNQVFLEEENVNMMLSFTGFKFKAKEFFSKWTSIKTNLKDLAIENEDDYDLTVYYENDANKKASATMANPKLILPSIFIPDSVKERGSDNPNFDRTISFCETELEEIKKDIQYNPA